jgi:hypothetical protein
MTTKAKPKRKAAAKPKRKPKRTVETPGAKCAENRTLPLETVADPNAVIFATICERIAHGEGLRGILRDDGMPSRPTFFRWLDDDTAIGTERRNQYAHARERQADYFSEEIVDIADDGTNDWMERQARTGGTVKVFDYEHATRSKLRVDARKWVMSKLAPKKYGDRVTTELVGKDGGPIETRTTTIDLTKATDDELSVLESLVQRSKPGSDPGGTGAKS